MLPSRQDHPSQVNRYFWYSPTIPTSNFMDLTSHGQREWILAESKRCAATLRSFLVRKSSVNATARIHGTQQLRSLRRGWNLPPNSWRSAWRSLTQGAGLPGFRFHDLRHCAITQLAENGTSDSTIMAIAGHVSRRMLERYSHVRMEAKRTAMEALAVSTRTARYDTKHDTKTWACYCSGRTVAFRINREDAP